MLCTVIVEGINHKSRRYVRIRHDVPETADTRQICSSVYSGMKGVLQKISHIDVPKVGHRSAFTIRGDEAKRLAIGDTDLEKETELQDEYRVLCSKPARYHSYNDNNGLRSRPIRYHRRVVVNDPRYAAQPTIFETNHDRTSRFDMPAELQDNIPGRVRFKTDELAMDNDFSCLAHGRPAVELAGDQPIEWRRSTTQSFAQSQWQARI